MAVTLEGEAPFSACVVELGSAIPIARMVMRPGDLNHPDAVETGDGEFDEVMQVTALATYAPTLQKLLDRPVRSALLEFLKRYPSAQFNGSRLRVPTVGGVTQQLVVDALGIAEVVAKRFAEIGFLESEPPIVLPRHVFAKRLAISVAGSAGTFVASGLLFDTFGATATAALVGVVLLLAQLSSDEVER